MANRIRPLTEFRDLNSWLRRLTRRLVGSSAEDLAQESWARKLARRSSVEEQNPRAYLAAVARNLAADQSRRRLSRGGHAIALESVPADFAPSVGADQESSLLLKQVILALPETYRDTFILNRFVGLTYAEIAARQGVSVKAVEYRMSKALALCQEALRD